MKKHILLVSLFAALFLSLVPHAAFSQPQADSPGAGPLLSHNVFFKLAKPTDEARKALVDACRELLAGHPGIEFFAVGVLASELDREVNDREFDVSVNIVFTDKAAHDAYQAHPKHTRFVEHHRGEWAKVRVFDSWVNQVP